ncbi:MAG: transcriptional regulator, partial [Stutzerimonas stutzeri]
RMRAADWLSEEGGALSLTASGKQGLQALGVDLHQVNRQRRQRLCACPDWSERKPHLGGALGAALLSLCEGKGWLRRSTGSRALQVSPQGRRAIMTIAAP